MPNDLPALQRLAFLVGRQIAPNDTPVELVLKLASGRKARLPVLEQHEPVAATEAEVRPGWDFSRRVPRYDGVEYPEIAGRPLAVLRVLAEANGPVNVDELRKAWDGYAADESTIRGAVAALRKKLVKLFPDFEGDPIISTGAGYGLEIR